MRVYATNVPTIVGHSITIEEFLENRVVPSALEAPLTDYEYGDSDTGYHDSNDKDDDYNTRDHSSDTRDHGDHHSAHHAVPFPPLTLSQIRKIVQKIQSNRRRNEGRVQKRGYGATRKEVHAV